MMWNTRLGSIRLIKEYTLVGVADPRGGERLGLLAVVDSESDEERKMNRDDLMADALDAIKKKVAEDYSPTNALLSSTS